MVISVLALGCPAEEGDIAVAEVPEGIAVAEILGGEAAGFGGAEAADTLSEARVAGIRPLRETGVNRTVMDSTALRENISLSLADVLGYNSSLFIKQYGRASLSTVSFRGTSASHTQVLWNGMKINSPMLGMTDFSMIPAYFMDSAALLHGTSSLQETGGGLGGAVILQSSGAIKQGIDIQYIQGLGSFWTADEFLKVNYGGKRLRTSTKVLLSTSQNRFKYLNMDKMEVVYDENMNIVERYHPVETHESGAWRDFHVMQELGWHTDSGHDFSASVWYVSSWRELPELSVDYSDMAGFLNEQSESTLRAVGSWKKGWGTRGSRAEVTAGYAGTSLGYDYARDRGDGNWYYMTKSRSRTNTLFFKGGIEQYLGSRWLLQARVSVHSHHVKSSDESILLIGTDSDRIGYDATRTEVSAFASVKWKPVERVGLSLSLREDLVGKEFSPVIPAFNADVLVAPRWGLYLKGSASRNYRYPTLNDLYFMPGGNPELRPESGISYDLGYSLSRRFGRGGDKACSPEGGFGAGAGSGGGGSDGGDSGGGSGVWKGCSGRGFTLSLEGYWFDSYIEDWILWVPNGAKQDFYTPMNIARVHAYGIEQKIAAEWQPHRDLRLNFHGNFTWSPSINHGQARSPADESVGKQLVYIPEFSSSFIAGICYRNWSLSWKWCWYSRRFTMTSNDYTISGSVPPYFMNDLTLSKLFEPRWASLKISAAIRNLFNEHYLSVLSRPMPGTNFEVFLSIAPKFKRKF